MWNGDRNALLQVEFRNAIVGTAREHFWSEGDAVGMARTGKGYFAMAKRSLTKTVQTAMPQGTYCNIIDDCATRYRANCAFAHLGNIKEVLPVCLRTV